MAAIALAMVAAATKAVRVFFIRFSLSAGRRRARERVAMFK
jgi:hypothetical protein